MPNENGYDFSGYVTRYNVPCTDGRTIKPGAFDCDGVEVPLVWNHGHDNSDNVLGKITLENRADGVYGYGSFNSTERGQNAKLQVQHGDITDLSIFANKLRQRPTSDRTKDVLSGVIKEVSLVLSGANVGAFIDTPTIMHGEGTDEWTEGEIYLSGPINPEPGVLMHADNDKEDNKMASNDQIPVGQIYNDMTEDQKLVVAYAYQKGLDGDALNDEDDDDDVEHSGMYDDNYEYYDNYYEGDDTMFHNGFEGSGYAASVNPILAHKDEILADINEVLSHAEMRDQIPSLKGFVSDIMSRAVEDSLAHGEFDGDPATYGIDNIEYLFPDAKAIDNEPDFIKRETTWVGKWYNNTKKSPIARIKTIHANITEDEARAKGYVTGNQKFPEVFPLLTRSVEPTTIYKLQEMDRDILIDVTTLNVIAFLRKEMDLMLKEEIARAGLVGDGRVVSDRDKINETNIKPVYHDADLYAVKVPVEKKKDAALTADAFIDDVIRSRKKYKGSGNPMLFCTADTLTEMLLLKDGVGRRLYSSITELATTLRVSEIVECEVMEGLTRTEGNDNYELAGIMINPVDYTYGADKGGEINFFEDFDIKFNQHLMLLETRCSGMLTKPYSAIVFEFKSAKTSG